jgi:hypothetical protein
MARAKSAADKAAPKPKGRPRKVKAALPPVAALGIDGARDGERSRMGPPIKYRPEFAAIARGMAKLGGTDFEIASELGVTTSTLWRWRSLYPDLSNALDQGKECFDDRAERSLAMKAVGYSYHSEKVFCQEGVVIRADIVEHVPPDVGAIKHWLSNRRPDKWREKSEVKLDGSEAFAAMWAAISSGAFNPPVA